MMFPCSVPRSFAVHSGWLAATLCAIGSATPASAQLINETFSSSPASNFTTSGGTWTVSAGKYVLSNPATGGSGTNNRAIHSTNVSGDWTLTIDASTTATGSSWNDFAIIFGYQNATNYYFFSSNEINDGGTSGIMKVSGGTVSQLADITTAITAGTTYAAKIVKSGNTYQVFRDNVLLASASDSSWPGGKVGFGTLSDGATFDNLVVTVAGGTVAAPSFNPGGGTYSSAQNVTITTATSGASIRYTTDGTNPTSTVGTLYSSPVNIGATATLKAIAYKSGMTNSSITSATYTINSGWPAKPDASNTGPSGTLTNSGSITVTTNGAVIQNLNISGTITVQANNVTIRNCRITGGAYGINAMQNGPFTGLLIEDCEIRDSTSAGIYGRNFTMRRTEIHQMGRDAIKPRGNVTVEQCYIHHLGTISGAHADAVQAREGGSNHLFRYNNIDLPNDPPPSGYTHNAAFILEMESGSLPNFVIDKNWLNGGNYTIYVEVSGVSITNNKFGRDYQYGLLSISGGSPTVSGNVWEDNGQPAP